MNKIVPQRISMDFSGKHSRYLRLHLQGDETIAWIRETPSAFKSVQADADKRLLRGDMLTVVDADSLVFAMDMPVLRANGEGCWLGSPSRLVTYEAEVLFSDGTLEVIPVGSRYGIRDTRSGRQDGVLYNSAKQAEYAILKRQPKTAA